MAPRKPSTLKIVKSGPSKVDPEDIGGGGGDGIPPGERIAKLEARMESLATKEDVANVRLEISNLKNWILGGVIGVGTQKMMNLAPKVRSRHLI